MASKTEISSTHVEGEILHPEDVDSILLELLQMSREIDDDYGPLERTSCDMDEFIKGGLRANMTHFEVFAVKTPVKTLLRRKGRKENLVKLLFLYFGNC